MRTAMAKLNPRYVAYAASHGRTPAQQLTQDDLEYPGGKMAGFLCWIPGAWRRWTDVTREKPEHGGGWSDRQHADFDRWLAATYTCDCWPERDAWGGYSHETACTAYQDLETT